ncbi:MAG: F0F1 ATP synthase subunit beta, partial [Patescibacteria group bacterium]
MNQGTIKQIIGPVVDIYFAGDLPAIYNGLKVTGPGGEIVLEAQQHLSGNIVRAVALGVTDGLKRGDVVIDTGEGIKVPVGKETL